MKKRIISIFVGLTISLFAFAQATLPTSCDFTGSQLPAVGWTASAADYYTASGNLAPAFKFKNTGNSLTINVASAPGVMSFDLMGNSFSGAGTFEVQESVDGITYTTNKLYDISNIPTTSYTGQSLTLLPSSRFIKFIYILKTGGNVGLDNVVVNAAAVSNQQMSVMVNGAAATNN